MAKKKVAKKAAAKRRAKPEKISAAEIEQYKRKYVAWDALARKVLAGGKGVRPAAVRRVAAAKTLLELGFEEAFIVLDAVAIAQATMDDEK